VEDTMKISREIMIVPLGYEMKVVWELVAYEAYRKVRLCRIILGILFAVCSLAQENVEATRFLL
jgi:hypothetical protein